MLCILKNTLCSKLDNDIHEDLSNFSGGELQRVAIARMLYKDSPILIFDEFSSSLDNVNAHNIEERLLGIKDKLLISVTHRIHRSLLHRYEKVIIIENGEIVHFASPDEIYREMQNYISTE